MGDDKFFQQKMKTYFKRIDFDKDGKITRKDFEGMAQRFIKEGDKKFSEEQKKDMETTLTAVWDKFLSTMGGGDAIDEGAFVNSLMKLKGDKAGLKACIEGPLPLFFHAVDTNNDGQIEGDEYKRFFDVIGLDPKMAESSFKAIDANNDGMLSLEEFRTAGTDFFLDDNQDNPHKLFWGPLEG